MQIGAIEMAVGWLGVLAILTTLGAIFYGIFQGLRHPTGRVVGRGQQTVARSPVFYLIISLAYFGACYLLWKPIPVSLSPSARTLVLLLGVLLFFPGLGLVFWGRLTLGKLYFVSTTVGAQLFKEHRLVTSGPYALVRHPMYLGILLTGMGGVLIYKTWTFVFVALHFIGLTARARREEEALEQEFGEEWREYRERVPPFFPLTRLRSC